METIITIVSCIVFCLVVISYLFGTEPQFMRPGAHRQYRLDCTYQEYINACLQSGGKRIWNIIIGTIAYPGAKLGRLISNLGVSRENKEETLRKAKEKA